jgi:Fe-S cluster assembly protein SufD
LSFTADASRALGGPDWLAQRRQDAFARFGSMALPTEAEDLWRYSDVDRLDLGAYTPASGRLPADQLQKLVAQARENAARLGELSCVLVTVDGEIVDASSPEGSPVDGLSIRAVGDGDEFESVHIARDAFDELHSAFVRDVILISIRAKSAVDLPVLVWHWVSGGESSTAHFPHLRVDVGSSAEAKVVEIFAGVPSEGPGTLVFPVTELNLSENAHLSYATMQILPTGMSQLGVQSARVDRDASLQVFCASLGGTSGRLRADAELAGQGAEVILAAGYMGVHDQLHDLRTVQDHIAPKTHSQLLCMGAVTDISRSAYVGLTRVRNGAHGADAFQTNHNLVLSEGAHADSVPNLDIQENDVRCSHASTVGPIDQEQLYYLESRGIEPSVAERLIVLGFFRSLAERSTIPSVGNWFVDLVSSDLNA